MMQQLKTLRGYRASKPLILDDDNEVAGGCSASCGASCEATCTVSCDNSCLNTCQVSKQLE